MFRTENNKIWLTRGDTAEFRPIIENYEAQEGDKVVFALRKAITPVLKIEVNLGENIVFNNDATKDLPSGSYLYDLMISTTAGERLTFVNGERFELLRGIEDERNQG